jgi:hypothetical protein
MPRLGNGAMTGGAERSRCDAERRVESSDESKIGRYSLDLGIGETALHNSQKISDLIRYFPARSGSVPGYDDGEGLKPRSASRSVRFQSAAVCCVAEKLHSIAPAAAMPSLTLWV